jgi:hypothetical protein
MPPDLYSNNTPILSYQQQNELFLLPKTNDTFYTNQFLSDFDPNQTAPNQIAPNLFSQNELFSYGISQVRNITNPNHTQHQDNKKHCVIGIIQVDTSIINKKNYILGMHHFPRQIL